MVLVREDRDIGRLLEVLGDGERSGRRDVVQADGAERRGDSDARLHDLLDIRGGERDREGVDAGERLEDDALGLGNRQLGERRPALASEEIRAIGEDGDGIPAAGKVPRPARILLDRRAGRRHAWRIDQREDVPVPDRHLAAHADQAAISPPEIEARVVVERVLESVLGGGLVRNPIVRPLGPR